MTTPTQAVELLPCAHCGASLEPFGPQQYNHPANGCWLAHVRVHPNEFGSWNRRSQTPASTEPAQSAQGDPMPSTAEVDEEAAFSNWWQAHDEPKGWREFIENIAKPYSEPLNSVCAYRDKESRKDKMRELRGMAAALLATQSDEAKEGHILVPISATLEIIVAIENEIDNQLNASGINPGEMMRQDGEYVWDAIMRAAATPGDAAKDGQ